MAKKCRIIDSKVGGDRRSSAENPMIYALSCQWPFGESKLDLKQSSLRRVKSNNLKLASWRAELVEYKSIARNFVLAFTRLFMFLYKL